MRRAPSLLLALALAACADAQTDPTQEIDPAGDAGGGGGSGGQGGSAGSGGKAGSSGSGAGQAGSGNAGGSAGSAGGAGASGQGGSSPAGSGGSAGAQAGQGGSAGSQAGSDQAGAGQAGEGQAGGGQGGSDAGQAGSGGDSGAAGSPFGGAAGDSPFGGNGGQPFGGGTYTKTCPDKNEGGAGGSGGGKGIAGGFCVADALGNPNDDPCYTCWNGSRQGACKDAFAACEGSKDCVAFFACWSSCGRDEDSCFKSCSKDIPAGIETYAAVRDCIYTKACPQACYDQCVGSGSTNRCNHTVCHSGYDLDPDCSPCAAKVCEDNPICCDQGWDTFCVGDAEQTCKIDCSNEPPGCVHAECATGAPLDKACSPCATKVCATMPLCCQPFGKWDLACAEAADQLCGP